MTGRIKLTRALICAIFLLTCYRGLSGGPRLYATQGGEFSLSKPLSLKWKFETSETLGLTPAVSRDIVYLPLSGGRIISLGLADGSLNWKAELGGDVSAEPEADESGVYVATETPPLPRSPFLQATGALRALGRLSGVGLWMRTLPAPIRGSLVSNETTLFGAAADGRVYAIKKKTGEVVWVKEFATPFVSGPVLHGGNLFVCDSDGVITGLEQASGNTFWRYRTRQRIRSPPSVSETFLYVGTEGGNVFAFETATGRLRWRARTGGAVQAVQLAGRCLITTSLDNFVYCLSPQKGGKLWKRQMAGRIVAKPLATPQDVLLSPLAGDESVVLDLQEGKKTNSIHTGEDNNTGASPVLSGGVLLLTTRAGLAAYSDQSIGAARF
ncbi:MAG TPA: PQQ-binding-like beta-propeller repeat protein [Pyrinomonadaceae bacterium]|nr:PQQ-binding-like beta-propeller repeat protein [Pyrinomonadaceae bacterium]